MPEIEEEVIGSQSENDQEEVSELDDAFKAFNLEPIKEEEAKEEEPPAKEEPRPEVKVHKFKHNKEEVEVDISTDEKLTDHLQRSLALDKERERVKQHETELNRTAKLLGLKDHAELTANLETLEKNQMQEQKDQFEKAKQKIIDELIFNGVEESAAIEYANNNPLVQEAQKAITEKETLKAEQDNVKSREAYLSKWQALYDDPRVLAVFPNIVEDSKAFQKSETPTFFTAEMKARIDRGYDPLDAMLLTYADKFQGQSIKATEQKLIKQQHLGLRAGVETNLTPDNEPTVPRDLANAFAAFGLPAESAKKYVKK